MRDREITRIDLGLLSVLMGVATTVFFYRYGIGNQISELPIVMRAIDPGYLLGDFYTDATGGPGPRFYFARLVALFANPQTLPYVCFAGVLLSNVATAWITLLTGTALFAGSVTAAAGAATLVMCVPAFRLGYADRIYADQLLASSLAGPLLLTAVYLGLRGRPLYAATAAGLAALVHPTFGPEGGAVALMVCTAAIASNRGDTKRWQRLAGAFGLLALFTAASAIPSLISLSGDAATPGQFLAIETFFRHPRHNLLSAQNGTDLVRTLIFAGGVGLSLWVWRRTHPPLELLRLAAIVLIALPAVCLLGALLFELYPTRPGAIARPLRLLWLSKWLGLIIVGGALFLPRNRTAGTPTMSVWPAAVAALLIVANRQMSWGAIACLGLYAAAIALLVSRARPTAARVALVAVPLLLLVQIFAGPARLPETWLRRTERIRPALSLAGRTGSSAELARWAREHTPGDAVFLAPPDFGSFRLLAERALVVDFKSFPFQNSAMREWQQRLFDCYGEPRRVGWDALAEMEESYRRLDVIARVQSRCRYGATYAIIDAEVASSVPARFATAEHKIIALTGR